MLDSPMRDELVDGHADVACDLAQQDRRDVTASMMGHRGCATIGVAILLVRATLPNGGEAEREQNLLDLTGFE